MIRGDDDIISEELTGHRSICLDIRVSTGGHGGILSSLLAFDRLRIPHLPHHTVPEKENPD